MPRRRAGVPSLTQFVVLSVLLHALFILLFGSPAGGSREGQALWGSLTVTIRGPLLDTGAAPNVAPDARLRLPGTEMLDRQRKLREAVPPRPPAPPEPERPAELATPKEAVVPATLPEVVVTPAAPVATELVPAPAVERIRRRELPVVPVPTLEATPGAVAIPALAPVIEAPPTIRPPVLPALPTPVLQTPALPASSPDLAPSVELKPVPPKPVPAPAPPVVPAPHAAPAPPAAQAPPVTPAPPATPAPVTERPGTPAQAPVARERESSTPGPRAPAESPIFNQRRAQPDATPPLPSGSIDLEAARARARQVAREGTGNRALLPFPMPPAPERKTREQIAIENARKPDCKDAYKGMGLLAVVPLIANEFGEGNCRW